MACGEIGAVVIVHEIPAFEAQTSVAARSRFNRGSKIAALGELFFYWLTL